MEPDEARLVHLDQVDHQRRDDARHQGQDVREQRPGAIVGRPGRAVALGVVALLAVALLAVALLAVALLAPLAVALRAPLAVALLAPLAVALRPVLAVALLAPLAVALRAVLAVALRAVLAVALRAVLRVSGVVHRGTSPFPRPRRSIRGTTGQNGVARPEAQPPGRWVMSGGWWPATPARSGCRARG